MRQALEGELKRVQGAVRNTYERSKANVAALEARFDALRNATGESGDARTTLAQLQSEADAIRGVYTSFVTRAEELSRQYDIGAGNSRIISEALPPARTTRASSVLVAIAGFLLGAAIGSAIAVALELLDGRVRSAAEVANILGVPVIAKVTTWTSRHSGAASDTKGSVFARLRGRSPWSGKAGNRISAAERVREAGVTRSAYVLTDAVAALPARIVFLSAGSSKPDETLVADIATSLADTGALVDLAAASASGGSPLVQSLAGTLKRMQTAGVPVYESLSYRRLDRYASPRQRSRAAGSLLSAAATPQPADFCVVDATGEETAARLIALVKDSDAIVIVIRPGAVARADLREMTQTLGPWKTKLVGAILVEAA